MTKRRELLQVVSPLVITPSLVVTPSLLITPTLLITPLLTQVVSPASPTYLHNLALSPDEIAYRTPPPYVAVGR